MHKQVFHQTGHQLPSQLTNLYFNQKTGKEEVGIPELRRDILKEMAVR